MVGPLKVSAGKLPASLLVLPFASSLFVAFVLYWWIYEMRIFPDGYESPTYIFQLVVKLLLIGFGVLISLHALFSGWMTWSTVLLLGLVGYFFLRDIVDGRLTPVFVIAAAISAIVGFALREDPAPNIGFLLIYPLGFIFGSGIFAFYFPDKVLMEMPGSDYLGGFPTSALMGLSPHPNGFGPVMAFGILILLARGVKGPLAWSLLAIFTSGLLWSGSDGSLAALVLAGVFAVSFRDGKPNLRFPWSRSIGLPVAILATFLVWTLLLLITRGPSSFTTGRTTIWASFLEPAAQAGFLGFGSNPDHSNREIFNETAAVFRDPHNVWLAIQLTGGHIGIALYLSFWIVTLVAISKLSVGPKKTLALGLALFLLVHGLVESSMPHGPGIMTIMYPVLAAFASPLKFPAIPSRALTGRRGFSNEEGQVRG